ncbi:hypothetical protein ACUTSW_05395 [Serratia sp. TSA_198.1]|uniref:hypothetical protein n=1 Tax=Serratia sp. TSA_198.1 TaxID=3415664 RepID=UPI0040460DDC
MKKETRGIYYKARKILVQHFVDFTDGWNKEFHEAIENNIFNEYQKKFPIIKGMEYTEEQLSERKKTIEKMREFYYQRMIQTATLLLASISIIVALIALILSI